MLGHVALADAANLLLPGQRRGSMGARRAGREIIFGAAPVVATSTIVSAETADAWSA